MFSKKLKWFKSGELNHFTEITGAPQKSQRECLSANTTEHIGIVIVVVVPVAVTGIKDDPVVVSGGRRTASPLGVFFFDASEKKFFCRFLFQKKGGRCHQHPLLPHSRTDLVHLRRD